MITLLMPGTSSIRSAFTGWRMRTPSCSLTTAILPSPAYGRLDSHDKIGLHRGEGAGAHILKFELDLVTQRIGHRSIDVHDHAFAASRDGDHGWVKVKENRLDGLYDTNFIVLLDNCHFVLLPNPRAVMNFTRPVSLSF